MEGARAMKQKHAFRYAVRDEMLISFGFKTYKHYLKSEEWAAIRSEVFKEYPECICCDHATQVVHHVRYDSATLLGLHRLNLAPLCKACHERIEINEDGEKDSLARANTLMLELARLKNPKQTWLLRFYRDRGKFKAKRGIDAQACKQAWRRKRDAQEQQLQPRDYSGVFWIRARRRR